MSEVALYCSRTVPGLPPRIACMIEPRSTLHTLTQHSSTSIHPAPLPGGWPSESRPVPGNVLVSPFTVAGFVAQPHNGLPRDVFLDSDHLSVACYARSPLSSYGIDYRGAYGSFTDGLCMKSWCSPPCDLATLSCHYRGFSLIRTPPPPLGPYRRLMPRVLGGS